MNQRWLFILSCIALITSAFTFITRGDIQQDLGDVFGFSQEQKGVFGEGAFQGMAVSMLVGAFICDRLGMKNILFMALFSHLASTIGILATGMGKFSSPDDTERNQSLLYWLFFLQGCGNGLTEVAINPLVATLFPRDKTHYLNVLHAWWPGGLILGGLLALFVGDGIDLGIFAIDGLHLGWEQKLYLILAPAVIYGIMLLPSRFPQTEAAQSGVPFSEMLLQAVRPLFLIWAFCMLLTAATELAPQQWQESVMKSVTGGKVSGTLILVYTSTLMFILRHFAGPIAHRISPVGLMLVSSALAGVGLYLLSYANSTATAFGYATIFGVGIAYLWPTMLGVGAERFPKGGALLLALLGGVGNFSISFVIPQMGQIVDHYAVQDLERTDTAAAAFIKTTGGRQAIDTDKLNALEKSIMENLLAIQKAQPEVAAQLITAPVLEAQFKRLAEAKEPDPMKLRDKALARGALDQAVLDKLAATDPAVANLKQQLAERAPVRAAEAYGFSWAFRWVSGLAVILVVIFGGIFLYDLSRGGYKPEILTSQHEHEERMSGGVQGPVE